MSWRSFQFNGTKNSVNANSLSFCDSWKSRRYESGFGWRDTQKSAWINGDCVESSARMLHSIEKDWRHVKGFLFFLSHWFWRDIFEKWISLKFLYISQFVFFLSHFFFDNVMTFPVHHICCCIVLTNVCLVFSWVDCEILFCLTTCRHFQEKLSQHHHNLQIPSDTKSITLIFPYLNPVRCLLTRF